MSPDKSHRIRLKTEVFKAIGYPLRPGIIEILQSGEMCVCNIVEHAGTGMSNVSRQLAVMKQAGPATDRREGLKIMYCLGMLCAAEFIGCVKGVLLGKLDEQRAAMARLSEPGPMSGVLPKQVQKGFELRVRLSAAEPAAARAGEFYG